MSVLRTRIAFSLLSLGLVSASCGSGSHNKGESKPVPEVDKDKGSSEKPNNVGAGGSQDDDGDTKGGSGAGPVFNVTPYSVADYDRSFKPYPDASPVWPEELRNLHEKGRQEIASYFSEQNASGFNLRKTQLLIDFKTARVELRKQLLGFDDLGVSIDSSKQALLKDATAMRNAIEDRRKRQVEAIFRTGEAKIAAYQNRCRANLTAIKTRLAEQKNKILAISYQNRSLSDTAKAAISDKFNQITQALDQLEADHCGIDLAHFYPQMGEKLSALESILSDAETSQWTALISNLDSSVKVIEAQRKKVVEQAATLMSRLPQYQDLELSGPELTKLLQTIVEKSFHESLNRWYWTNLCTNLGASPTDVSPQKVCGQSRELLSAQTRATRLAALKDAGNALDFPSVIDQLVERLARLSGRSYVYPSVSPFTAGFASLVNGTSLNTQVQNLKDTLKLIKSDNVTSPDPNYKNTYLFDSLANLKADNLSSPDLNYKNTYLFDSLANLKADNLSSPDPNYKNTYLFDSLAYLKADNLSSPDSNYKNTYLFDSLAYLKADNLSSPDFNYKNTYLFDCIGYTLDTTNSGSTVFNDCLPIADKVIEVAASVSRNLQATEDTVASATKTLPGLTGLQTLWERIFVDVRNSASNFVQSPQVQSYGLSAPRNLAIIGEALVAPLWQGQELNPQNLLVDKIQQDMSQSFSVLYR